MANSPTNIYSAIVNHWDLNLGLGAYTPGIPLNIGRTDETEPYPRACFNSIVDDIENGFNASKVVDKWVFQFSIFDIDSDRVADLMDTVINSYNRVVLSMTGGQNLQTLKIDSGLGIEPNEDPNSENIYMGWIRFKFWVDN